ncbi:MAG: multiheme c-type cytochrome [Pirellulaceae bacterium]
MTFFVCLGWLISDSNSELRKKGRYEGWFRQEQTDDTKKLNAQARLNIAADWEAPEVALFVTGDQRGYIEPCGCTGLENQKGGLMRKADCQRLFINRGWNPVSIDAGDQLDRSGVQATRKLQASYQTYCRVMNYEAIGFGPSELNISGTDLAQPLIDSVGAINPFTCANVTVLDESLSNQFRIIERNGKRIGITSILGDEYAANVKSDEIVIKPALESLRQAGQAIQTEKCDLTILIAQASKTESLELAKAVPVFDLVITGDSPGEPTLLPEKFQAGSRETQLIEVGAKGMFVGLIGCYWKNGKLEMKYERIPLDARFDDNVDAKRIFVTYQEQLKQLYQRPESFPDITPRAHPSGNEFAGTESCQDCHEEEYDIWKNGIDGQGGPHARATLDLTDPIDNPRAEIKRNFDPECLSCHVTGWNPQKHYPYKTGYYDLNADKHLHGNGCENCHGPAKRHVDVENGDIDATDEEIKKIYAALHLNKEEASQNGTCLECHDTDNSPDFAKKGFDEYWKHIAH